ncbi:hypothetical protein GXP67_12895 [Rhodocytophaga rosea]|uniref:Uncharacterized protein n=1 Tax=Rhodocytophaga rosea TaxID=2704465 RepID=A0A6C0GHC2_9BACT|nr:hypothetical protein [Rhodocytophaga rosea]QHT67461.1 hypothetical protein GXP67_12895 [Rhodocytophaga rosea]
MSKMTLPPKRLFLIDSLGGLLSAFLLGVVLARFENMVGMPQNVLYLLSFIACVYAVFSFINHWQMKGNWRLYMKVLASANGLYCCLTIALVIYYRQQLTTLGLTYFLLEVVIIILLAYLELKIASL